MEDPNSASVLQGERKIVEDAAYFLEILSLPFKSKMLRMLVIVMMMTKFLIYGDAHALNDNICWLDFYII